MLSDWGYGPQDFGSFPDDEDEPKVIRLEHDDQVFDMIFKINKALAGHGVQLVDDEQEHDGYVLLKIVVTPGG